MTVTILYNPQCSKCRQALAALEAAKVDYRIREYLKDPLSTQELEDLHRKLGSAASGMLRTKEAECADHCTDPNNRAMLIHAVANLPKLMERPILIHGDFAVVARSPEAIDAFLSKL